MPERSVRDAFRVLAERCVPTSTERAAAQRHRAAVYSALESRLNILQKYETGSFTHGTGVRGYCDVDVLVSLNYSRPTSSDTALRWVKDALTDRYGGTPIRTDRPAVIVDFANGAERWEVTPAFYVGEDRGYSVYDIPGRDGQWTRSAPRAHLDYVSTANRSPSGGAKTLTRLIKRWKYANAGTVRISSFYLEMQAAKYMTTEPNFVAADDFERLMRRLVKDELRAMQDPKGVAGYIAAASGPTNRDRALATLRDDSWRITRALELEDAGQPAKAFDLLDQVFPGVFPGRRWA